MEDALDVFHRAIEGRGVAQIAGSCIRAARFGYSAVLTGRAKQHANGFTRARSTGALRDCRESRMRR